MTHLELDSMRRRGYVEVPLGALVVGAISHRDECVGARTRRALPFSVGARSGGLR